MSRKTIVIVVIIALLSIGSYYLFSFGDGDDVVQYAEKGTGEELSAKDKIILEFVEQYDVNTDIPSDLIYTFQMEDEFIKKDKPIIFTGSIDDIFRKDGEFYMRFAPTIFDWLSPRIFYTLSGCGDEVDEIVSREHDFSDGYVVVAKITSIKKPILGVDGSVIGTDEVELEYSPPNTFLASGECLDLAYVKEIALY